MITRLSMLGLCLYQHTLLLLHTETPAHWFVMLYGLFLSRFAFQSVVTLQAIQVLLLMLSRLPNHGNKSRFNRASVRFWWLSDLLSIRLLYHSSAINSKLSMADNPASMRFSFSIVKRCIVFASFRVSLGLMPLLTWLRDCSAFRLALARVVSG